MYSYFGRSLIRYFYLINRKVTFGFMCDVCGKFAILFSFFIKNYSYPSKWRRQIKYQSPEQVTVITKPVIWVTARHSHKWHYWSVFVAWDPVAFWLLSFCTCGLSSSRKVIFFPATCVENMNRKMKDTIKLARRNFLRVHPFDQPMSHSEFAIREQPPLIYEPKNQGRIDKITL